VSEYGLNVSPGTFCHNQP